MQRKKLVKIPGFYIWDDQLKWLKKQPEKMSELIRKGIDLVKKEKEK